MPWSVGAVVSTGDVLTASRYNQDVIENLTMIGGAWTAYTPTWTNLTVGNATQASAYIAAGKLYVVRIKLTFGSTTSISGIPEFTLPNSASHDSDYTTLAGVWGLGTMNDVSGPVSVGCTIFPGLAATRGRFLIQQVNATYMTFAAASATIPFTWTTGDQLEAQFMFEAA
jgi:hypothetical protein